MTSDDQRQMYELEYPAPAVEDGASSGPTLIVAMQGYADAGHAVEGAAGHLKAALDSRTLATFNNDELIDYRSRRPMVTLSEHEISDVDDIDLDIRVLRDSKGESFLLLSGPEPDLRWEAFSKSVADLADRFNVDKTICLYAAPMGAPHTRPLVVSAHGNDRDLVGKMFTFDGMVSVPGAAAVMIERELHSRGRRVAGYTAHVPHYVASSPYPQAVYQLLQSVSDTSDLQFPLRAIERDMERVAQQLAEQTHGSEEIAQVVAQLEQHYDSEMDSYRKKNPQKMMPGEAQVPSGDEIGEAFENFLAAIDDRDRTLGPGDGMWEDTTGGQIDMPDDDE
ncbi:MULTISPECIES: PAC2 family protein [unclassified Corynebacterium]|uniref:PAC2 family protein n=1 Tax=unclassified Corynebacterium TaxID=2624378 RepID=UPI0021AAB7E4|nr:MULTISPECIES: PAC2 family protein [unclassified Corynebacterium]MCT1452267.1 PAC2 family protein [Corynebacterium sp. p3-SID1145]MCT1461337.1 PAC2 family protein [Corynebacterium sp. p3-SID1140]MDN8593799.1 PAC2 family protein [Corynebacterium sp. P4_F2]WKK55910.1 PAC2 family protein [Corynebacterium sp. P4-C1]WKK63319.1 PAC2 family protein [Corynebacterium sp. P8-C1]